MLAIAAIMPAAAEAVEQLSAASVSSTGGAADIIVTARKRSENLKDVPASILVVNKAQIANLNAKTLEDLNGAAPNLHVGDDGTLTIRGISSTARNVGFEAGAAEYIDGVYQGRPIGNNQDLTDIERVEVLRGPQGTLYGKNTTAGAISIVTVRPGDSWTGRGEVQYGEENDLRVAGYVAGPVVADTLGIKLSGFRRKSDGYGRNVLDGVPFGNYDSAGGRGEIRLTTGPFDVSLRGDYTWDDGLPPLAKPVAGFAAAFAPGRDEIAQDRDTFNHEKSGGVSLTGDVDLGGGYTLTSISAWRAIRDFSGGDDDSSPLDAVYHRFLDKSRQVTQEVRLASPSTGRFSWIVGGYYFHQRLSSVRPITLSTDFPAQGVVADNVMVWTDSFAAFANGDYHLTDKLTLNAGVRFTSEHKRLDFVQTGIPGFFYPDYNIKDHFTDTDVSPTASLSYKFSPAVTTYIKFSRGFKSGGWNPDITTTPNIKFDPEKVNNFEAGLRTSFAGGKLGLNLTAYYMDYSDLQVSQLLSTSLGYVITNAGKARVKGVEVELTAQPVSWLTLTANAAYNDARYHDFDSGIPNLADPSTTINYAGQRFTFTPAFSGFLGVDTNIPLNSAVSWKTHGDVRYQSKIFFDDARTVSSIGPFSQKGYAKVNLLSGLSFRDGLEVMLFVDNLTNNRALENRASDALGFGLILDQYTRPREIGGRVSFKF
ncbi:TonB-dependent receptor [Sphingomonas sp. CGMCC 1.13654]|uniref:TonB-dependent receptor n=1 Tax=Sphingomonas chungangi TaxID=2683589 RepID=A0A838L2C1_9SPHN|nr:TonB-dependent receptor [Sphingomonas chungangi]MBA2933531.1 TonB-dependent receptor [Sphingomonas chungangi]